MDIFCCPVPPSRQEELHLTDGVSYNYNCQFLPPAALKTIIKRLGLSFEAVIEAAKPASIQAVLLAWYFSEREHSLERLHVALRFNSDGEVKVFSLPEIYGANLFSGARMEDSGGIAGGYKVGAVAQLTITSSMYQPRSRCKNVVVPGPPFTKPILELAKLSTSATRDI